MKFVIIVSILILTGCTNPMNEKITKSNYEQLLSKIKENGSEEDVKNVMGVIMMNSMSGALTGQSPQSLLEGKSFNEHIALIKDGIEKMEAEEKLQKAKEQKEKEIKDKAKVEEDKRIEELTKMFEFSNYKKSNWETEYGIKKYVEISMNVKNISLNDIDAFEGWLKVYDKLDNELARFYIKETKLLKKNTTRKLETSRELNMFSDDRISEVSITNIDDLKLKFFIEKIVTK